SRRNSCLTVARVVGFVPYHTRVRLDLNIWLPSHPDRTYYTTMDEQSRGRKDERTQGTSVAGRSAVHVGQDSGAALESAFESVNEQADVLVLAGDLTDYGLPEEARVLAREVTSMVRIPVVAVLGNHDYESGREKELCEILGESGIRVLDGDSVEILGVGFAG